MATDLPRDATDYESVPCGLCGVPTSMTGTKRCDACWELETRILGNRKLAEKILSTAPATEPESIWRLRAEEVGELGSQSPRSEIATNDYDAAVLACVNLVEEYDDQHECGDVLDQLATNMRFLKRPHADEAARSATRAKYPCPNGQECIDSFACERSGRCERSTVESSWVSVSDRKPENYATVLLDCSGIKSCGFWNGSVWSVDVNSDADPHVVPTHWMPTPGGPND